MIYNGLWFTAHRADLNAYIQSTQRFVTGDIRVRLHKGTATVVGRQAPKANFLIDVHTAVYIQMCIYTAVYTSVYTSVYHWDSPGFAGIPWDSLGFPRIRWDSLGFTGVP